MNVLLVDDDKRFRTMMSKELPRMGFTAEQAGNAKEALAMFKEKSFDVVLLDLKMPDMSGIEVLKEMKQIDPLTEVIMLTGHASMETAIDAIKLGAHDYLTKPCRLSEIEFIIKKAGETKNIKKENAVFRRVIKQQQPVTQIIGSSTGIKSVMEKVKKVAPSDASVLIEAESGTGKELVANAIHQMSSRRENPFVVVNCGSLPEALLEAELFGHTKGAFSGAVEKRAGLCEVADKGTLFLDEIAEMSLSSQVKLLRMLQSGEIRRLGDNRIITTDLRIIAATNRDLKKELANGNFREDLYYRLNVVHITLPSLKDRKEDIPLLSEYFLNNFNLKNNTEKKISDDALKLFKNYGWPGNIRELENTLERLCIFIEEPLIEKENMLPYINWKDNPSSINENELMTLSQLEEKHIKKVLSYTQGNKTKAAALLGITLKTLYNKINTYKLPS